MEEDDESLCGFLIGIFIRCFFVALGEGASAEFAFWDLLLWDFGCVAGKVAAGSKDWVWSFCDRRGQGDGLIPLSPFSTSSTSHRRDLMVEFLQILLAHKNVAKQIPKSLLLLVAIPASQIQQVSITKASNSVSTHSLLPPPTGVCTPVLLASSVT